MTFVFKKAKSFEEIQPGEWSRIPQRQEVVVCCPECKMIRHFAHHHTIHKDDGHVSPSMVCMGVKKTVAGGVEIRDICPFHKFVQLENYSEGK